MDATAGIVILLFVATIFYASAGDKGKTPQKPVFSDKPPIMIMSKNDNGTLPPPNYLLELEGLLENDIKQYILSFKKQKVSEMDANYMATCITKYGRQYNVNPKLIAALICRESSFNPYAVSPHGAMGLGQLLPKTAESMNITNPFDINQNIMGTTRYVRSLLDRYPSHPQQVTLALASYLEGPNAVVKNGGYTNTTGEYIKDIYGIYWQI